MVSTDAFEVSHSPRRRWLRRASVAAIATAVLGIGGTGLSVAVASARQPDSGSSGTTATPTSSDDTSSDDSGSSSSSSGLGSASSGSTSQGGSNGS